MKKALLSAILAVSLTLPSQSNAGLEEALENMLGANVQVNSGGPISSARRGGFYGGSVYIRGRVMNVNVLNFTPPSFSSGCGGIDIFAGSFSMINKEQFIALLRSIAQNAAGYAFQLALKNICEQCATIMAQLQKAIQAMNEFSGNSCQLAQGIVNQGIKALELGDVKGMQGDTIVDGFQSAFDAFWGDFQSTMDHLTATNSSGEAEYDKYEVNIVWSAMKDSAMSSWFSAGGGNDLLEALMSLTGTIVVKGPVDDANGNPSRKIQPITAGSYLTPRDLIYGNDNAKMLSCSNTDHCLHMTNDSQDFEGLVEMLRRAYLGTGPSDTNSVMYSLVNGTGNTNQAASQMIGEFGELGSMVIGLARVAPKGSVVAYRLFEENVEYIAYELARKFIVEAVSEVEQAIRSQDFATAHADDWRTHDFMLAVQRIGVELDAIGETMPSAIDTMQTYIDLYGHMVLNENPLD